MSILSFEFLVFGLLLLIAYYSLPLKWRPWVLLAFSLVFVYFGSAPGVDFIALFTQPEWPPLQVLIPLGVLLLLGLSYAIPFKTPMKWRLWLLAAAGLTLVAVSGSVSLIHLTVLTLIVWGGATALCNLRQDRLDMEACAKKLSKSGPMDWADDKDWQNTLRAQSVMARNVKSSMTVSRVLLALLLVLDLGSMIFIKFYPTVMEWLNAGRLEDPIPVWELVVPLGLSYFTFQSAGYLVDVYRGKADAPKNPLRTLLFVGYFLQLPQGPISTWKELEGQLSTGHKLDPVKLTSGFQLMMWGYFKKMVLADRLAPLMEETLKLKTSLTGWLALGTAILYAIRLYADFSGGMDVVRGLSRMVGVEMPENFRRPFFSKSVAEYWRRWHITLGAWFRSYLLYPLTTSKFGVGVAKFYGKLLDVKWSAMVFVGPPVIALFTGLGFLLGFSDVMIAGLWCGLLLTVLAFLARFNPQRDEKLSRLRPLVLLHFMASFLICLAQNFYLVAVIGLIISAVFLMASLRDAQWGKKTSRAMPAALTTVLVFFLIGIWHTITLNAVVFGLYFGILMAVSTLMDPLWKPFAKLKGARKFFMDVFRMVRTWVLIVLPQFFAFTTSLEKSTFMLERTFSPITTLLGGFWEMITGFFQGLAELSGTLLNPFAAGFGLDRLGAHFLSNMDLSKIICFGDAFKYWSFETFVSRCTNIMSSLEWIIAGAALLIILVVDIICECKNDFCDALAKPRYFFIRWPLIILLIVAILVFGCYGTGFDSAAFLYTQF